MSLRLAFFDKYLKGDENSIIQENNVRVFITGLDEWRSYATFPPKSVRLRKLFLHSEGTANGYPNGGSLSWNSPKKEVADTYVYDPRLPTPSPPATLAEPIQDFRAIEIRNDVLIYTTVAFEKSITLLGNIELMLYAASDGRDTDWFATLTEVLVDGRSIPFYRSIGALRARYRKGFDQEALLIPNEPTLFNIPLGPTGHRLAAGARLRLSICSAFYPECDPNTNTGNNFLTDTDLRVAKQTVFHDMERPTHIILPILEEE
jgi:putative CocE/NonD family hydrolase